MIRTRRAASALLLAAVLALSACAGFPAAGPVNNGLEPGGNSSGPDFAVRPDSPQPGATPEQIVSGFLRAGSGPGLSGQWSVAREFLAPGVEWIPTAGVTIDAGGDRSAPVATDDGHSVKVAIAPVATVDATGAYEPSDAGSTSLAFSLEQIDGEWRITKAPDGVLLDSIQFPRVFGAYPLMYFDLTWTYLVPDVRWFPPGNVATTIAKHLIDGDPSPWLAQSVRTAFPAATSLAQPSVPIQDGGIAQVELSSEALAADRQTHDRMQTQLEASLADARVAGVQMSVGQTLIEADETPPRSTRVAALPLVLTETDFGFLAGDEVTAIPGLSEAVVLAAPASIQVGPDQDAAAVRFLDGSVGRIDANGDLLVFDPRVGLVDPSIDPGGYVWSVPRDDPAALRAFAPDGTAHDITGAWAGASQIAAMSVSHDGTRIAAVVVSGSRTSTWVAGIVRDADGVPVSLSEDVLLAGTVPGPGRSLTWTSDGGLGILAGAGDDTVVVEQPVGGPTGAHTPAPSSAVSIAGANTTSPVRLRADDGGLLVKRGANWQQTASGIRALATQQGLPQ